MRRFRASSTLNVVTWRNAPSATAKLLAANAFLSSVRRTRLSPCEQRPTLSPSLARARAPFLPSIVCPLVRLLTLRSTELLGSARLAAVPDGAPTCVARRHDRLKSSAAIHRREFVTRDPCRTNQQCRCMPRSQPIESGTTRGGSGRVRAKGDFRRAEPGGRWPARPRGGRGLLSTVEWRDRSGRRLAL